MISRGSILALKKRKAKISEESKKIQKEKGIKTKSLTTRKIKEITLKKENEVRFNIGKFPIVLTKIHRSLQENEVDEHRNVNCILLGSCLNKAKNRSFSCKKCPQFKNSEIEDEKIRKFAYLAKFHY